MDNVTEHTLTRQGGREDTPAQKKTAKHDNDGDDLVFEFRPSFTDIAEVFAKITHMFFESQGPSGSIDSYINRRIQDASFDPSHVESLSPVLFEAPVTLCAPLVRLPCILALTAEALYLQVTFPAKVTSVPCFSFPIDNISAAMKRLFVLQDEAVELFLSAAPRRAGHLSDPFPDSSLSLSLGPVKPSFPSVQSIVEGRGGASKQQESPFASFLDGISPLLSLADAPTEDNPSPFSLCPSGPDAAAGRSPCPGPIIDSLFLVFTDTQGGEGFHSQHMRDSLLSHLGSLSVCVECEKGLPAMQAAWVDGQIDNFTYISGLNTIGNRSHQCLSQYPVYPWVLRDYTCDTIDLEDRNMYRDLSLPVAALDQNRLEENLIRYQNLKEFDPAEAFMYGSHYSTPGYVIYFLLRSTP
ncbi:hypothetical protein KIPB_000759, partial [Kipferlia bialata]|eukprot:g759.t1